MMMNLFSMFDPSSSYSSSSWLIMLTPLVVLMNKTLLTTYKKMATFNMMLKAISKEVNQLSDKNSTKGLISIMLALFTTVVVANTIAIMPMNFTTTAHVSITFTLSAILWTSIMVNALANSFYSTMVHLTPMGTPNPLMNFMVLIEMVSQIIRPITLAVRLMANMVAGHLLMNLLSNFSLMSMSMSLYSSAPMFILVTLESGVALIQAYVITVLSTLYYKETF